MWTCCPAGGPRLSTSRDTWSRHCPAKLLWSVFDIFGCCLLICWYVECNMSLASYLPRQHFGVVSLLKFCGSSRDVGVSLDVCSLHFPGNS